MKTALYRCLAILSLSSFFVSCTGDTAITDPYPYPENYDIWEYKGGSETLGKIVKELGTGPHKEELEKRLAKKRMLWRYGKFLLVEGKKTVLVPFSGLGNDRVEGVLSLVRGDHDKVGFDIVEKAELYGGKAPPFWTKGIWLGYYGAMDGEIFKRGDGPGAWRQKLTKEKKRAMRWEIEEVCGYIQEEYCWWQWVCDGNMENCSEPEIQYCDYIFEEYCWYEEVYNEENDPCDPDSAAYDECL